MNFNKASHFLAIFLIANFASFTWCALPTQQYLDYVVRQYAILSERIQGVEDFIHTGDPLRPTWNLVGEGDWVVGFHGGSLWMLFKLTQDPYWERLALEFQERVRERQFDTSTHDVGFIIMTTFGHGLELTGNQSYVRVILNAARSLSARYVPAAGVLRSWNGGEPGEVTVIADNMMNLELLQIASGLRDPEDDPPAFDYTGMVYSHSLKTRENHFREDGSVHHVVAFNNVTGQVMRKYNVQGYDDESAWSRGLAWVINGYVTIYELTNTTFYLESAEIGAKFFIDNLPEDWVPYYDFRAPYETQYVPRDTSAAAIAAHGLLKLYKVTGNLDYFSTAEKMLESLMTPKYRADGKPDYRLSAIVVNGTSFYHQENSDTALVYGDYYFLRALDLYNEITSN